MSPGLPSFGAIIPVRLSCSRSDLQPTDFEPTQGRLETLWRASFELLWARKDDDLSPIANQLRSDDVAASVTMSHLETSRLSMSENARL